jgi:lysine 2,3-aminomutase
MSPSTTSNQALANESLLEEKEDEPPSPPPLEVLTTQVEITSSPDAPLTSTLRENEPGKSWCYRKEGSLRKHSGRVVAFHKQHFGDVPWSHWNDWHWQVSHRIRTVEQLERYFELVPAEREALSGSTLLPFAITPYYLALLDAVDPSEALRRTVVPNASEFVRTPGEADDPLGEESHAVVPGVIHRYPDRVLFLAVDYCATYCRYCTRSRVVGSNELTAKIERWRLGLDYIRRHTEIRDVLVSGGDPLSMSDERLDWLLTELRRIPHVEFLRMGTKMPAVLPQRITKALVKMLKKHHPLWMSLHFIHPNECTPESRKACERLADAGIPLGAQAVLLKGVNDDAPTLKRLFHRLLMMRVRPYYLYQCDPISGSRHFRTTVEKGIELISKLRGYTTGYAVPTYVVDAPGGGGKIPLGPDYLVARENGNVILRNFEGKLCHYPEGTGGHLRESPAESTAAQSSRTRLQIVT